MKSRCFAFCAVGTLLIAKMAFAQTSSGEISGRVIDSSDAVVVDAQVTLTNQDTGDVRETRTDRFGNFLFPALQPGVFRVTVSALSFQSMEKRDLKLSASERLSAGDFKLAVGGVTEEVSVTAAPPPIQIESAARSAVLDSKQISTLMTIGRDPLSLLRTLPGIVGAGDSNGRDDAGDGLGGSQLGTSGPGVINGVRGSSNAVSIDGVSGNPRGDGNKLDTPLNVDAVAEVTVQLTGHQAEYGQSAGGIVNLTTKSGTSEFHGSAYYYGRNEALNANDFFRNYRAQPRDKYRFNTYGASLGGPVSKTQNKLFFFFSMERWPTKASIDDQLFMMPTAAERSGDFSNSYDTTGRKIYVKDPLKNTDCTATITVGCFNDPARATAANPTGLNIIPADRINPNTQKLLGIFPLPTIDCTPRGLGGKSVCPLTNVTSGNPYNYSIRGIRESPANQEVLRVDYNLSSKWRMFFRGMHEYKNNIGLTATTNNLQWGIPAFYKTPTKNAGFNVSYIASPTVVNEFNIGYASWNEFTGPANPEDARKITKDALGINLGQNNPAQNPFDIVPRVTGLSSGGANNTFQLAQAPQITFDNRYPMNDRTGTWEATDGITKIWNQHSLKAGIYYQTGRYLQSHTGSTFNGNFNFGVNNSSPFDTQYAYSNVLLGSYGSYSEGSNAANYDPHWHVFEWYVQDHWKLKPNLSLDYGIRFTYDLPTVLALKHGGTFVPERYDPNQVPALYQPVLYANLSTAGRALCKGNFTTTPTICAQNPNDVNDIHPSAFNGTFVSPFGYTGTVINNDPTYPRSLRNSNGLIYAPRFGIAWDPGRDGNMVIRLGAGLYYNTREGGGTVGDFFNTPPVITNASVGFGQITRQNFAPGCGETRTCYDPSTQVNAGPLDTRILQAHRKIESTLGANVGIQRKIGFDAVLDVAYVGTFGRHLNQQVNLNTLPYLTQLDPKLIDTTQTTAVLSGNTLNGTFSGSFNTFFYGPNHGGVVVRQARMLADNYSRRYPGYANVNLRDYGANSNYHGLQTSLNRRFTQGLEFGIAYTWSRVWTTQDVVNGAVATYQDRRFWNYGLANFDRTHNFVAHWVWSVPRVSQLWNNKLLAAVLDNWDWSGIAEFVSGSPYSVNISSSGTPNLTGGGDTAHVLVAGNIYAPKDKVHSTLKYLNQDAFALPPIGVIPAPDMPGITRNVVFRGPGSNNWNMALQKNIPITEHVKFTVRAEAYKVFNHPSFTMGRVDNPLTADFDTSSSCAVDSTGAALDPKCGSGKIRSTSTFGQVTGLRFGPRVLQLSGRITF
jgi:Carboxypeptidase regulatory-like domain